MDCKDARSVDRVWTGGGGVVELRQVLQDKLDWLRATPGIPCAQVKMTADELAAVLTALDASRDSDKALTLCRNLLDPEGYGFAVTAEVRDAARDAIGLRKVETAIRRDM